MALLNKAAFEYIWNKAKSIFVRAADLPASPNELATASQIEGLEAELDVVVYHDDAGESTEESGTRDADTLAGKNLEYVMDYNNITNTPKSHFYKLTHEKVDANHNLAGLAGAEGVVGVVFTATGDYMMGDTLTIDNKAYTVQLTSADEPEDGLFVTDKVVWAVVDTEVYTINFKAGGGLTGNTLAQATATEETVLLGSSFYAGDKTLKEGTYDPEWAIAKYW